MNADRRRPAVALVLLLALCVRGGVMLLTSDALRSDPDDYRRLAANLVEYGTFGRGDAPTAFRPPLYPLLLVPCVSLGDASRIAVAVLHIVLGVATVGLIFPLARRWGLGFRWAMLAAILVACDPILLNQSTQVMTETLAAFLTTAALLALARADERPTAFRAAIAGVVLALDVLCRPIFLVFLLLACVALAFRVWTNSRLRLRFPFAFLLAAALTLCPWAVRNQIQFGRPIVTTTHGGFTLLLANNSLFYDWLHNGRWGDVWDGDEFNADWDRQRPHDELQDDRMAYDLAMQTIRNNPATFAYACAVHVGRFWSPLPHRIVGGESAARRMSRYAVAAWYLAEYATILAGAWLVLRRRKTPPQTGQGTSGRLAVQLYAILSVVCLTAAHTFYWTDMRMRAPVMPVLALLTAAAACAIAASHERADDDKARQDGS